MTNFSRDFVVSIEKKQENQIMMKTLEKLFKEG
jgi:hypothetical protein